MAITHKTCSKCKVTKKAEEFNRASGGKYLRPECKPCEKELARVRREIRESAPPVPEDYVCPICEENEEQVRGKGGEKSGAWCCDHDHETNTFRGWLCHQCNRTIGSLKDDIARLYRAIKYLEDHIKRLEELKNSINKPG